MENVGPREGFLVLYRMDARREMFESVFFCYKYNQGWYSTKDRSSFSLRLQSQLLAGFISLASGGENHTAGGVTMSGACVEEITLLN